MNNLYLIIFILCMATVTFAQDIDELIMLQSRAVTYYNDGDYSNAIILYEDLLAEQEFAYDNEDVRVAETLFHLGELYLLINLPDIADYYFNEATIIFQKTFQAEKKSLETILLNLLKIYSFQNDTIMMKNIEQQLYSISTIFQSPDNIYPEFLSETESVSSHEEDLALDKMNLGLSYINHGLYSEAAIQFNEALDSQTENLDLQFFEDFLPHDTLLIQNIINAFSYQIDFDTTGASYFYLALFSSSPANSYKYAQKYIYLQPLDIRGILLYANLLFNNNEWSNALFQYRTALWVNNDNFDAQFGVGLCLFYIKEYEDAINEIRKALKIDPYNHRAHYYLGLSLLDKDKYESAIASFTQSLLLDPDNSDTYLNLGKSYFEAGKIIQAREAFSRVVNIDPQYGAAHYYLGLINENIMEIDKAVESYTKAREYSPQIEDVHYRLGMLLYRIGELKGAMEPLREYIIYQPDSIHVLEAMGNIFISETRFQEAIDTYKRIREEYPEKLDINLALAESYHKLKEYEKAIAIYKQILLFDDENVDVMFTMGNIYNNMGLYEDAEDSSQSIQPETEEIENYFLFHIPEKITLSAKSQIRNKFLNKNQLPYNNIYHISHSLSRFRQNTPPQRNNIPVYVRIELLAKDLGNFQIPGGKYKVYEKNGNDLTYIGTSSSGIAEGNDMIKLEIGKTYDILCNFTVQGYKIDKNRGDADLVAIFENRKDKPVTIKWIEQFSDGRWEITHTKQKYVKLDAYRVEFTVELPANSKKEVSFSAKIENN